ncbi:MAG: DUF4418 family protein [Syntrophomonas sp.]
MLKNVSKTLGFVGIIIGVLIALTPRYIAQPCQGLLELKSGMMVHMVCHWSGQAAMIIGILVMLVGILQVTVKNLETTKYLGIVQAFLGISLFLVPKSYVIGICKNETMACHHMASVLTLFAVTLIVISLVNIFWAKDVSSY